MQDFHGSHGYAQAAGADSGGYEDKIEASGFHIRFQCTAQNTKFLGDVNRMYRVVQNVLENALKYSMKGTRIFIDISENCRPAET